METVKKHAKNDYNVQLSDEQIIAFKTYQKELMDWNSRINLTAIRDENGILLKHFLDSLSCMTIIQNKPHGKLVDVGTGGGFPGIPIKIACPQIKLTLVESVGKKVKFCEHIVKTLKLENVEVIQARAEEIGQDKRYRESFDWVVARAVSNMSTLAEYLLPLTKLNGTVIAQKGESGPAESQSAEKAIRILGGHIRKLHKVTLPGVADERYLVIIDKVASTPPQYPRRVGIPLKSPLL
jgi:16S rRNA (guanine527-N7)-methyltransferase